MRYKLSVIIISIILLAPAQDSRAEQMLSWDDCVREAKKDHPDLVSAAEKLNQAKAAKEVTRSGVMPLVTGAVSEMTSKSPSFGGGSSGSGSGSSGPSSTGASTDYTYGLNGQQLLFDGFKTSFDISTAERNIRASRYNYDVTSSNIRLRLRTAFADLLTAQEFVIVAQEIEARRKQNLELVKSLYDTGREHKGSLLTSQADVAQATYQVNQSKRSIYLAQRQLNKELGRAVFIPAMANGSLEVKDSIRERPDFETIAQTNPTLEQLIALKEAAKYGLLSSKAAFFPQIYATGNLSNTNTDAFPDKNEWSVGTSLSLPIFDYSVISNVTKAKAALGQAEADQRSGRDGVIYTLSNTWTQLQNAVDNVEVQREFLEASKERAKIAEAEYSIGLISFDNWIIIEDDFASAKTNFLTAELNALLAEANWIQAKGGTLDHD